jgi:hypothetical protein
MKGKNFFLLTWKKMWIIVVAGFVSTILHNLISGLMGTEEGFFFIIVIFVIPAYLLITVVFTTYSKFFKKTKTQNT